MLKSLMKGAMQRVFTGGSREREKNRLLELISEAQNKRKWRTAIELEREFLELDPNNVNVLASVGMHLVEVGEHEEANEYFDLAHRLDDSNMHVAVNYARCLMEGGAITEAMSNLVRAQVVIPGYPHVSSNYATLQFRNGSIDAARHFSLRAWLADFDNDRLPDSFLWLSAYTDRPEESLAAEHLFWAKTCLGPVEEVKKEWPVISSRPTGRKLRVGYWSPDFRDHSVRYFFRPLLEGHDREKVDLYLYHDASKSDGQTDEIRAQCDHFYPIYEKSDAEVVAFIASHDLDVLVELAGHTSHNRLWLLQGRLARVQVTGLGYPPTTGLQSIDAKFIDPHLSTPSDAQFYSEKALVLPQSFWCFDPREDGIDPVDPPVLKNGYITFGCFGNAAKMNPKMYACWAEIMRRVPRSRLLLRSLNFVNPITVRYYEKQLQAAGMPLNRISLLGPVSSQDFFRSYGEVDIVLDTHPFNGGTTTCFATYMGVPVVTLAGSSLIGRMGASVVSNAGAPELAVDSIDAYVRKAVSLSQDITFLKRFRKEARLRMREGSLGDGHKFARDVEGAYEALLQSSVNGGEKHKCEIRPLAPEELVRRAATVLLFNQWEASRRILGYCLENYPDFAGAHILMTEDLTKDGNFRAAAEYLEARLENFAADDLAAALINIVRFRMLAGDFNAAGSMLDRLESVLGVDFQERAQAVLYRMVLDGTVVSQKEPVADLDINIKCIIVCDEEDLYDARVMQIKAHCDVPASIAFLRCPESVRMGEYEKVLDAEDSGVVVFLQKNVTINNPEFFVEVVKALETSDVVGFSGARLWGRLDWRLEDFSQRSCAYTVPSVDKPGLSEIQIAGNGYEKLENGFTILDGAAFAVRASKVKKIPFNSDLLDAGTLLEEAWTYEAARGGSRLAVHRGLGVHVDTGIVLKNNYLMDARLALVGKMKFDVFSTERNDGSFVQAPCSDAHAGFKATMNYLSVAQN